MDRNPAILVGKKPGRLASQGSPRRWGGAITCVRDIRPVGEFQPRIVEEFHLVSKKKKRTRGAILAGHFGRFGRTGSVSSSWWGGGRGWAGASGGAAPTVVATAVNRLGGRLVERGTKPPALPTDTDLGETRCAKIRYTHPTPPIRLSPTHCNGVLRRFGDRARASVGHHRQSGGARSSPCFRRFSIIFIR